MLLRSALGVFLSFLREAYPVDLRGSFEHGPDCRRHHSHAHRLRTFFTVKFRRLDGCRSARLSPRGPGRRLHSLAMPIMFGSGAIATILGMVSTVKHSEF